MKSQHHGTGSPQVPSDIVLKLALEGRLSLPSLVGRTFNHLPKMSPPALGTGGAVNRGAHK